TPWARLAGGGACVHNTGPVPLIRGEVAMAELKEARVPDIGDFDDVPVIEVLVAAGDRVEKDQGLVTLESDKATMEVPAPFAGVVGEVRVSVGDRVAEGTVVAVIETGADDGDGDGGDGGESAGGSGEPSAPAPAPANGGGDSGKEGAGGKGGGAV